MRRPCSCFFFLCVCAGISSLAVTSYCVFFFFLRVVVVASKADENKLWQILRWTCNERKKGKSRDG